MNALMTLHAGAASHSGLQRAVNEDRILVNEAHGLFLVVDGLGGHQAGETAAETAVRVIGEQLANPAETADSERQVREAILAANNHIFALAQSREQWAGMACVLTLALVKDEHITIGHVGDSRLYMIRQGVVQKVTSDHSPVGEWEENGVLTEAEAIRHPRRHEIFRDVGSEPRLESSEQFVQIKRIPFPSDAALLLCTDGLTDSLTTARIKQLIGEYGGNPEIIAGKLIEAANQAGGKDNISVIFVTAPDFRPDVQPISPTPDQHSITRMRVEQSRWRITGQRLPWILFGTLLGIMLWAGVERMTPHVPEASRSTAQARATTHAVSTNDARGIITALGQARAGDVITVPPGEYLGPLVLKDQVSIIGSLPGRAIIRSDPASPAGQGVAVTAQGVHTARIENLEIASDKTHPLRIGIAVTDSSVNIVKCKVSGAIEAGISITGASEAVLTANVLSQNPGAGITARDGSLVRMAGNWITDNGKVPGMLRAGLEIAPTARLEATNNLWARNGLPDSAAQSGRDNISLSGK